MLRDVRKEFADLDTALTVLPKLPRRFQQISDTVLRKCKRPLKRQWLAVIRGQARLRIERVHVRGTAMHKQENHSLGPRREMRLLSARADQLVDRRRAFCPSKRCQAHQAKPASRALQGDTVSTAERRCRSFMLSSVYVNKVVRGDQRTAKTRPRKQASLVSRKISPEISARN